METIAEIIGGPLVAAVTLTLALAGLLIVIAFVTLYAAIVVKVALRVWRAVF